MRGDDGEQYGMTPNQRDNSRFDNFLGRLLEQREAAGRRRSVTITRRIDEVHVEVDGRTLVDFSSNDYLGLSFHPRVREAVAGAVQTGGFGAGASPLISGHGKYHESAERALAAWKSTESAVLLPSGYQANHAAIQSLAALPTALPIENRESKIENDSRFLLDKLSHASLIDAVRSTAAPFRVFPHNNLDKLRRLLEKPRHPDQLQVVITESIFSMDGDAADLAGLDALKRTHPFILVLDEAHTSGVYGPAGAGLAAERGLSDLAEVTVVTCSKALGAAGGAICASRRFCEIVRNFGRAYIYSTAVPPAAAAAVEAALGILRDEPHRQQRLRQLARQVRHALTAQGWAIPSGDSPIVPILLGHEDRALEAAARLRTAGLLTLAIRPPTVAAGASRLRLTLSAMHSDQQIERLITALGVLRSDMH